jgi:uncharacterized damage-inducible protein DinB
MEGGTRGPRAWANEVPCPTMAELMPAQAAVDRRLIALCEALTPARLGAPARMHRETRVQVERIDRVLLHLFQHQVHHRGQAHAMLAGTGIAPPQLDEFFSANEAPLRAAEFAALGFDERTIWAGSAAPA